MTTLFEVVSDPEYERAISAMLWSYSRLSSFDDCKYGWFVRYIAYNKKLDQVYRKVMEWMKERLDDETYQKVLEHTAVRIKPEPHFFSTYGRFMHHVLEQYLSQALKKEELVPYFLDHYDEKVVGKPPSKKVEDNFFNNSLSYLENIDFPYDIKDIVAVEKEVHFMIGPYNFVGFIDVLAEENGLHIADHKSHGLRFRSNRKFQTEYDKELDRYYRQPYIYSIPIKEEYGKWPATLDFNCYRHGRFIAEAFDEERLEQVKQWVLDRIEEIKNEREFEPDPEFFRCTYICDTAESCPFRAKNSRRYKSA